MVDETEDKTCSKLELLDKLEGFKRYTIAIFILLIFAGSILIVCGLSLILAWKGNFADSVVVAQWAVTAMIALVGPIIGFYFGSKQAAIPGA
jgi:hypothetical protein